MSYHARLLFVFSLLVAVLGGAPALSAVRLPYLYSDHMVLQRGKVIPIRGTANPAERVTVSLARTGKRAGWRQTVTASNDGAWNVTLPPQKTGGPYELTVKGENTIVLHDVLFGEVWLCSGQSNMAFILSSARNADQEIAAAKYPQLRLYSSPFATRAVPQTDVVVGAWKLCTPQTARDFSAVGYLFGRDLQQKLKIPVGIIISAAGGTVAESWINQEGLRATPELRDLFGSYQKSAATYPAPIDDHGWQAPEFVDTGWKSMNLPGAWEQSGQGLETLNGAVWYRREVTIPDAWAGKPLTLHFSAIDDGDVTYFNGQPVGAMNVDTPMGWKLQRQYPVPATAVKAGRAVIAVRITDQLGGGGFVGQPEEMWLASAANPAEKIALDGAWKYAVVESWPTTDLPTSLYNGMTAPWTQLPVAGIIWYQGESNAGNAAGYRKLLPGLISGWRAAWKIDALPFLIVQLPNYQAVSAEPVDNSSWAALRESQALIAADMPHVGLAVTIDLGEAENIHPQNKQDVAQRLTLLALAQVYGKTLTYTGPRCDSAQIDGTSIRLHFTNIGKGLVVKGDKLQGFAIAGKDKKYVWADATITGDSVVVRSEKVAAPVAVRYAWADNPVCTLFNADGFPAAPFRTDGEMALLKQ